MPKQMALAITPHISREVRGIIPAARFQELTFWEKLDKTKQSLVLNEGQQLAAAMAMETIGGLAIGAHLVNLFNVLGPKGFFKKFLRQAQFPRVKSYRQARRYMDGFIAARENLTEPVVLAAAARGMELIGIADPKSQPLGQYTQAHKIIGPPPRTANPDSINRYLDQLEKTRAEHKKRSSRRAKAAVERAVDPETRKEMTGNCFRFLLNNVRRLSKKQQEGFLQDVIGPVLTEIGITSAFSFKPEAVPEEFKPRPVGRPAAQAAAAS